MDFQTVLESVEHDSHHLNRYIKFVGSCQRKNETGSMKLEKHHICPKADDMFPQFRNLRKHTWNLVKLTPRQHIIAHYMLMKAFPQATSQRYALWAMNNGSTTKINSRLYETVRNDFIETVAARHKGKVVSAETRAKISANQTGRKASEETRAKMSATRKGKNTGRNNPMFGKIPSEERRKQSSQPGEKNGMFGRKHSPESIQKMREARKRYYAERA